MTYGRQVTGTRQKPVNGQSPPSSSVLGFMADVVGAGSSVLLDINNGEKFVFARINPSATLKIGKKKYMLEALIGSPLGAAFETRGSSLERSERVEDGGEEEDDQEAIKDNRNLVDNNTAQTLSAEEIDSMKRDGSSGQEIVKALIANSVSFETKTAFSQEKYRRKKQKKYAPRIIVRRPTARSVCEAYFSKTPSKIGFLRTDSLSLILSLANVGDKSNVLVLDMFGGLLTAAVAERLSGFGTVCSTYCTLRAPSLDIVKLFNFDSETTSRIYKAPVSKLLELQSSAVAVKGDDSSSIQQAEEVTPFEMNDALPEPVAVNDLAERAMEVDLETPVLEESEIHQEVQEPDADQTTQRKSRTMQQPSDEELSLWVKEGFTSLIIGALNTDSSKIVQQLLPLIAPSSPFVIYHTYLQPLAECMFFLQKERLAVNLQLSEPWLREYQVLPSRTHPHMQMSSTGGYVLSGLRVAE